MNTQLVASSLAVAVMMIALMPSSSLAFPSLFNRPRLFQRQQQQQQAGGQQEQSNAASSSANAAANKQHQDPFFVAGSNMMMGIPNQFSGLNQHDLLRLSAHQHQNQHQHQQHPRQHYQPSPIDVMSLIPEPEQQATPEAAQLHPMATFNHQHQLVNKIEQQIGQQFDMAMNNPNQAASGYVQPSMASNSEESGAKSKSGQEKDAAASEEQSEGGEEIVSEKSDNHNEQKEQQEHEPQENHHHEEKHEHHPEAFEVHHKKGGKSFQYFHQGHSQ